MLHNERLPSCFSVPPFMLTLHGPEVPTAAGRRNPCTAVVTLRPHTHTCKHTHSPYALSLARFPKFHSLYLTPASVLLSPRLPLSLQLLAHYFAALVATCRPPAALSCCPPFFPLELALEPSSLSLALFFFYFFFFFYLLAYLHRSRSLFPRRAPLPSPSLPFQLTISSLTSF